MGLTTPQRAVVAVVIGFAIPVVSWAVPGERGPQTLPGALLQGVVIAVLVFALSTFRQRVRSGAVEVGRSLREKQEQRRAADPEGQRE
jgi:hypothetical protein